MPYEYVKRLGKKGEGGRGRYKLFTMRGLSYMKQDHENL